MTNNFRMSYFMPPIAPIRNEQGQTVTPATLTPFCEVSVEQVLKCEKVVVSAMCQAIGMSKETYEMLKKGMISV